MQPFEVSNEANASSSVLPGAHNDTVNMEGRKVHVGGMFSEMAPMYPSTGTSNVGSSTSDTSVHISNIHFEVSKEDLLV